VFRPVKASVDDVQGPYSDEQIENVLLEVDLDVRLRTFTLLLRNTGCDVVDAVLFDPARIRDLHIDGRTVSMSTATNA
jgi:hypothetical protein